MPLAQYITGLYTSGTKTETTNNNVKYNRVTSKNLINDRLGGTTADYNAGNIRYYGSNPNNILIVQIIENKILIHVNYGE